MICRGDSGGGQMREETAPRGGELVHLTDIFLTLVLTDREQQTRCGDLGLQQDGTELLHVHLAQAELRVDEAQMNGLQIVEAAQTGDTLDGPWPIWQIESAADGLACTAALRGPPCPIGLQRSRRNLGGVVVFAVKRGAIVMTKDHYIHFFTDVISGLQREARSKTRRSRGGPNTKPSKASARRASPRTSTSTRLSSARWPTRASDF